MNRSPPDSAAWRAIRERLAQTAAAIAAPFEMTAEQAAALLDERARELAEPLDTAEPGDASEHLVFGLNGTRYALPSNRIFTVCRLGALVTVPGLPEAFVGITSWSGFLMPVVDLRTYLNLPLDRSKAPGYLIVLGLEAPDLALVVETVEELALLRTEDVVQTSDEDGRAASGSIKGVTRDRIILLDAAILAEDPGLRASPADTVSN